MLGLAILACVLSAITILPLFLTWLNTLRSYHPGSPVESVQFWHPSVFERPLSYVREHIERGSKAPDKRQTAQCATKEDFVTWATDLILTSAASISPFSQGKANLFIASSVNSQGQVLKIRSKTLVGSFPLEQLVDTPTLKFRDMAVPEENNPNVKAYAVAAQAVHYGRDPIIEPIESTDKTTFASRTEVELGTTHILGIPLRSIRDVVSEGDVAVITVDLRFKRWWFLKFVPAGPFRWHKRCIIERAKRIQKISRELYGLQ